MDQKWKIIHLSIRDTFMGRGIEKKRSTGLSFTARWGGDSAKNFCENRLE